MNLKGRQKFRLERVGKGIANHRRIQILATLSVYPDQSLTELVRKLKVEPPTASEHLQKMVNAGLVHKYKQGNRVLHALSPLGLAAVEFLETALGELS